ncbi:MAG TPA: RNA polymerase sigma factor [Ktedonobacterales bacterium]|nr:RNA polymerase sigma factor [Ktedonobacterales bacterium]
MHEVNNPIRPAGEDSPVDTLYRRHAPAIFAYLRQHTATRADAEDLLLDVFVTALEHEPLASLPETGQLAWLWRVARNKTIDHYRRSARRPTQALDQVETQLADREEKSPEHNVLREDEYRQLRTLLEDLTPLQRDVLRMRFADGLRCGEIALMLGKKESAVRVMLMRTLRFLRAVYAGQDEKE